MSRFQRMSCYRALLGGSDRYAVEHIPCAAGSYALKHCSQHQSTSPRHSGRMLAPTRKKIEETDMPKTTRLNPPFRNTRRERRSITNDLLINTFVEVGSNSFATFSSRQQIFFVAEFVSYQSAKHCVAKNGADGRGTAGRPIFERRRPQITRRGEPILLRLVAPRRLRLSASPKSAPWPPPAPVNTPVPAGFPPPIRSPAPENFVAAPATLGKLEVLWRQCRLPPCPQPRVPSPFGRGLG